jgi:hypothetical protein
MANFNSNKSSFYKEKSLVGLIPGLQFPLFQYCKEKGNLVEIFTAEKMSEVSAYIKKKKKNSQLKLAINETLWVGLKKMSAGTGNQMLPFVTMDGMLVIPQNLEVCLKEELLLQILLLAMFNRVFVCHYCGK